MTRFSVALLIAVAVAALWIGTAPVFAYSGAGAAQWADANWNSDPPGWPTFSNDCTNFVSLALWFGGGYPMTTYTGSPTDDHNWYMDRAGGRWTFSWSVAADQKQFQALHYPGGYYAGTYSGTYGGNDDLSTGDQLYYDWTGGGVIDHMSLQVGFGTDPGSGWVGDLVDQHTTNRYHAYWTLQPYNAQASSTIIYEYRIDSGN
jgi:hypothetical protein